MDEVVSRACPGTCQQYDTGDAGGDWASHAATCCESDLCNAPPGTRPAPTSTPALTATPAGNSRPTPEPSGTPIDIPYLPVKQLGRRCHRPLAKVVIAGWRVKTQPLSHFLHILGHRTLLVARKIRLSCPTYKEKLAFLCENMHPFYM